MNIFVGASARLKAEEEFADSCSKLLTKIAKIKDVHLVFGAYHQGLMKKTYDIFQKEGKKITGIALDSYKEEFEKGHCSEEIVVDNSLQRFAKVYELSDVLLFLPGGIGTYSELLAALEERKNNPQNKLIILYNEKFFYTPFIEEMYRLYKEGYVDENLGSIILISNDIDEIVNKIKERV